MTISASLVARDNGSLTLPTDAQLYSFHWIHTPLLLTSKVEADLTSTIRVVANVPGDFPVSVWVTAADCWMCQPVARSLVVLPITGEVPQALCLLLRQSELYPGFLLGHQLLKRI